MRKKNTARSVLTLGVVAGVLAGCGSSGHSSSSTGNLAGSSGGTSASTQPKTAVKVAFLAPLTSGNSTFALQMENSAKLAVKDYNSSTTGRCTLSLDTFDDQGTAEATTQEVNQAITGGGDKVVVGTYTSVEGLAVKTVAERSEVVYFSTSSLSPSVTKDATYSFRTSALLSDYPSSYVSTLKNLNLKSTVIVADDSPSGKPLAQLVATAMDSGGLKAAGSPIIFKANSTDMTATVQQAKADHPDSIILLGGVAADQGLFIKTAQEQGLTVPILGNSALSSPDTSKVAGSAYNSATMYALFNRDPSKPQFQSFVSQYTAAYGATPVLSEAANQTYDAVKVVGAALDQNGCATGSALVAAVHALPPQPAASGPKSASLNFQGTQNGFQNLVVPATKIVNGQLQSSS